MGRYVHDAVVRLQAAVADGRLAQVCRSGGVDVMVLFGSAVPLFDRTIGDPRYDGASAGLARDIDIGVLPTGGSAGVGTLELLRMLAELIEADAIDVMRLDHAGPVARQRALTRGRKIFEARPGLFAETQIAAMMEYYDTEPMRELGRELLATT